MSYRVVPSKVMVDIAWCATYSVREGYRMLMNFYGSRRKGRHKNWRQPWTVKAPPKARHVLWRVCRDCIPTLVRLLQCHVDCTPYCLLSNEHMEDDLPCLFYMFTCFS
ncbi:unnamed protein product [Trifolium pratense]|uniref:Uncharacterized protein n=1 Tax=Trifolium pratense TaxID=57577 RepID=A0ACB0IQG8_TRIPR|nr:unnamed protein product [Trifolium pratense]